MLILNQENFKIPRVANDVSRLENLAGAELAIALAEIAQNYVGVLVVVVPDFATALRLEQELSLFSLNIVNFN